jgi:hypothetical protein
MPMRPTQDGWRAAELHAAEQEAIREIAALRAQGRPLRAIADAARARARDGLRISHEAWRRAS